MLERMAKNKVIDRLQHFPVVALLGPRQVGKTTLARDIEDELNKKTLYLDLEKPSDLAALSEPELFFASHQDELVILDEIQRVPNLFTVLRSVVDERRRQNKKVAQFLLLGSASIDLIKQSAESLAGRISYIHLAGLHILELGKYSSEVDRLWLRGGFPDSFLADTDGSSQEWRQSFIRTYLERDIPQLGPRVPSETLRRFWIMLAHNQGSILNASRLAAGLGLSGQTIGRYVDLMVDLLLVRSLYPWQGNAGKRMVKSPKVYVRDLGLVHTLLGIESMQDLLSHPVVGFSWEGFAIENILANVGDDVQPWYYRNSAGTEIDLLLEYPDGKMVAIECKRTLLPAITQGFKNGCLETGATKRFIVYPGDRPYFLGFDTEVVPLNQLLSLVKNF